MQTGRCFLVSALLLSIVAFASPALAQQPAALGIFSAHSDIGETPLKGSATYDAKTGEYRITGGGANMWARVDAFHFVWKKLTGDFVLTADVHFLGKGAVDHRKAVLAVRQTLDPNSAYADVAFHGDGMTSLQFRPIAGAETSETRTALIAPTRIRFQRRGAQLMMEVGKPGEPLAPTGPTTVAFEGPVYVGLGVCSHDASLLETAVFSNVELKELPATPADFNPTHVRSNISVYDMESKSVRVVYSADKLWEAPNWSPDGKFLLANSGGAMYRLPLGDGAPKDVHPEKIGLDPSYECNNDHGLSADGKWLAFSAEHGGAEESQVYVAGPNGEKPHVVTAGVPSYFHGWSPDGRWLAFVGERGGNYDIYRVSVNGGDEQRLTSSPGFDDGPDYSPDGKWIYINSDRSGGWDIWRFPADGAGPNDSKAERVTADAHEDWFPHPSPDGKWLAFLSFPSGTKGHDFKTAVQLRLMRLPASDAPAHLPTDDEEDAIKILTRFFGGQGTINVNSWSPDSKQIAFVSYEMLP